MKLGERSWLHGVIVGPDGAPSVIRSDLNAIVRVEPRTGEVRSSAKVYSEKFKEYVGRDQEP